MLEFILPVSLPYEVHQPTSYPAKQDSPGLVGTRSSPLNFDPGGFVQTQSSITVMDSSFGIIHSQIAFSTVAMEMNKTG